MLLVMGCVVCSRRTAARWMCAGQVAEVLLHVHVSHPMPVVSY